MSVSRQCARPGCGGAVAAWLTYDYAGRRVWLDDPGPGGDGNRWAMCGRHADRLRVPRGWVFIDRRTAPPVSLTVPPAGLTVPAPGVAAATDRRTAAAPAGLTVAVAGVTAATAQASFSGIAV